MRNIIFNMAAMHRHGSAFYDFLRLRKSFFVDQLGWDIPHDDEVEMDQYDNPQAWYVVVLDDDDHLVGGARVMPNTARWGSHTFMLKDAVDGKLGSIPSTIMDGVKVGGRVWEVTRIAISDELQTQAERSECLSLISVGCSEVALKHGATELICLSLVPLVRALRSLGFPVERRGTPYVCADDGRQYAVLAMPLRPAVAPRHGVVPASLPTPTHRSQPAMVHAPQKD
jgi:acyl homoserine lactone synthase